ncbi:MAG: DUF192 domain-containing protein [Pseudomonadota bacterium]
MASAQASSVIFERADVTIESPPSTDKEPKPSHPTLKYSVESRPEDALRLEYIHTLNGLTADTGVLIVFDAPSMVPLPAMKVYTPVDALFIADDGTVVQILPNVVLGDITQEIKAREPVKAFFFIKAGEAAMRNIHPRDTVSGKMFAIAPPVQQ